MIDDQNEAIVEILKGSRPKIKRNLRYYADFFPSFFLDV